MSDPHLISVFDPSHIRGPCANFFLNLPLTIYQFFVANAYL
jgi:hypothetical protein